MCHRAHCTFLSDTSITGFIRRCGNVMWNADVVRRRRARAGRSSNPPGVTNGSTGWQRSCRKDCTVITERRARWDTRRAPPRRRSAPGNDRTVPSGHERARDGRKCTQRESDGPAASPTTSSHEISLSRLMRMHVLFSHPLRATPVEHPCHARTIAQGDETARRDFFRLLLVTRYLSRGSSFL